MTIEPNGYKALQDENKQLQKENKELLKTKQDLLNNVRKYSCKYLEQERKNKKQDEYIKQLENENYELQNSLITHQINLYDKTEYIDTLKNELLKVYIKNKVIDDTTH